MRRVIAALIRIGATASKLRQTFGHPGGGRDPGLLNRALLVAALLTAPAVNTALATVFLPTFYSFDIPRSERRSLEQAACGTLKQRLRASHGWDNDEDRSSYNAHVHCSPHRSIDGHPVVYSRSCDRMAGWNCDKAVEVVLATFDDRRINVYSDVMPAEETYAVVKHFVTRKLFEPGRVGDDLYDDRSGLPLDECRVHYRAVDQLELDCQHDDRYVQQIRSKGEVKYRQIPFPHCATTDNPACVAEE